METEYKYADTTKLIIGAAFEVHKILKNGFAESVYHKAFDIELRQLFPSSVQSEFELPIFYKTQKVGSRRVDFFIDNLITVEIKAVTKLEDAHIAQAINYLEVFDLEIGLLINFGAKSLEVRRLYNSKFTKKSQPKS